MISPFATVAAQISEHLVFTKLDEARARINKYFSLHMRIRQQLSSSLSLPAEVQQKSMAHNMHMNDVGTLMVTHKKPFRVRFSMDSCRQDTLSTCS